MSHYIHLQKLIQIDSPTGFTQEACRYIFELLSSYGYKPEYTNKGGVRCALGPNPTLAIAGHVDTLGAMVCGVRADGHLKFTVLGGPLLNGYEGEYCRIYTMDGKIYTGTLLINDPSVHANREAGKKERSTTNMFVRLDEDVNSKADTEKLGIANGDFICFDTKYQELPNGYIKGRYMDNKAGCYVQFEIARQLSEMKKEVPVELIFSNYEEVGHGGTCGYSDGIEELLVIDMGVVGEACAGKETLCSICAKDSSGPYDFSMRKKLVQLAQDNGIPHVQDVYPFYGSDGSAALRAGNDFRVGLIGPGVAASHGMERTHRKGVDATVALCMAYINEVS